MDYFAALSAFVEAAHLGNFSRAAEKLDVKASTVSRSVRDLEADLGIALFNRTTRSLALTEGGRTFLEHAIQVLDGLGRAKAAASALNQHPRGHLHLIAPSAFSRRYLIPLLGAFMARHPEVRVHLTCVDAEFNLIDAGADLAVRAGRLDDSSLKARRIADERWVACASPSYLQKGLLHPRELDELEIIGDKLGQIELAWSRGSDIFRHVHVRRIQIDDLEGQLVAARHGMGIAFLPVWLVEEALNCGELQDCLPQWKCNPAKGATALWFIYPPKKIVSTKVRSFIDFTMEHICTP
ncbi:LysR family transcriptional regulator [Pantoea sp. Ap-967]|uniref:LysR family transcriptional regulator n=1 Tax=Pantoea sp. Ap-967 TaxID=2608362 RepID=UPI0014234138|nr:LysR family transcriptional regulator [Pantoea sp. Ap-967]NIE75932.1 LysR family transcriptional regulator [Pantoea sp. Ap-967]